MKKRRFPRPDGRARIVPSLLAADFADLGRDARRVERAGADWMSVDVMDGHFVPNLSFGPDLVRALKRETGARLDAHLMVEDPGFFSKRFVEAGADLVIFHLEACREPRGLLRAIRSRGAAAGLAFKPKTPASAAIPWLEEIDLALVMTVEPGFGGQPFMEKMLPKIKAIRGAIDRRRAKAWLCVDGGIGEKTVARAAFAGADALVAGTSVFGAARPEAAYLGLRRAAEAAFKDGRKRS